jgi:hypothetical protein
MMRAVRTSLALLALAAALPSCMANGPGADDCVASGPIRSSLVRRLGFARQDPEGISEGFDLDGRVSDRSDTIACGRADFTTPGGTPGIDNQIARLVPLVEMQAGGVSLDDILETAINNGQMLIAIELDDLDDELNDSCVTVQFRPLMGTPSLGTDGLIEIGQTFDARTGGIVSRVEGARLVNGVLDAGPAELSLPVTILDASFVLHVHDALVHIEIDAEGNYTGAFGGGIDIAEMITVSQSLNVPSDLMGAVMLLLNNNADLARDPETNRCGQISATLLFESVPAFVYD